MLDSISYMQPAILSALDMFSYGSYMKMLFTFSLSNRMVCFITATLVMFYLVFLLIKSLDKLLIFPTSPTGAQKLGRMLKFGFFGAGQLPQKLVRREREGFGGIVSCIA